MLIEKKGLEILDEIDSSSPTPGGGSVSALVAALGISLSRMYAHLSIHKKKFLSLEENVQQQFHEHFSALESLKAELIQAIDQDCEAYDHVMTAYRLPKTTDEENQHRQKEIQKATYIAIESPYHIMELSLKALHLCEKMIEQGNKNAVSDLACGILFLDAAVQGAGLNVEINLSSLDEKEKLEWNTKMENLLNESHQIKARSIKQIKTLL